MAAGGIHDQSNTTRHTSTHILKESEHTVIILADLRLYMLCEWGMLAKYWDMKWREAVTRTTVDTHRPHDHVLIGRYKKLPVDNYVDVITLFSGLWWRWMPCYMSGKSVDCFRIWWCHFEWDDRFLYQVMEDWDDILWACDSGEVVSRWEYFEFMYDSIFDTSIWRETRKHCFTIHTSHSNLTVWYRRIALQQTQPSSYAYGFSRKLYWKRQATRASEERRTYFCLLSWDHKQDIVDRTRKRKEGIRSGHVDVVEKKRRERRGVEEGEMKEW